MSLSWKTTKKSLESEIVMGDAIVRCHAVLMSHVLVWVGAMTHVWVHALLHQDCSWIQELSNCKTHVLGHFALGHWHLCKQALSGLLVMINTEG